MPGTGRVRSVRPRRDDLCVITIDQALLIELDLHPRATAEELGQSLPEAAPATIARWLRAHEGWLVQRDDAGWTLSPQGEGFLTALD